MKDQQGNALFLILIAVALFAALSYAVTNSGRGGAGIDKEQAEIAAAEIFNYATLLDQTIMRLRISGCALNEISFENDVIAGYTSLNPRTDNSCNIFHTNGGGLSWKEAPEDWLEDATVRATYSYAGADAGQFNYPLSVCVYETPCGLSETKDLIVGLKYLKKEICDAVNKKSDLTTSTSPLALSPAGATSKYRGVFQNDGGFTLTSSGSHPTACIYSSRSGYTFYHVLETQ